MKFYLHLRAQDESGVTAGLNGEFDGRWIAMHVKDRDAVDKFRPCVIWEAHLVNENGRYFVLVPEGGLPEPRSDDDQHIDELNLGTRCYHSLVHGGYRTVGDIMRASERELLRLPNFGRVSLTELKKAMAIVGHHIGEREL